MKLIVILLLSLSNFAQRSAIQKIVDHAKWQTTQKVTYNGKYIQIDYPGGDVPSNIGVCTDVIIRAYRTVNIDLQKLVHEDMLLHKVDYDNRMFYNKKVDSNIDHRRTFNLRTFFTRKGAKKSINSKYIPGDLVFWNISGGHVGIVIDIKVPGTDRYYIVHNRGSGPKMEDFLYRFKIIDHYRW
jgi:uncharacterized protein YijF (DUF1287 family)